MRIRRLVSVSTLAVIMLIGFSHGTTNALEPEDWAGAWFKIKVNLKAACDDLTDSNKDLHNGSGKEASWIYFDSVYDGGDEIASFLIIDDNGMWQAAPVTLNTVLGNANDFVLESDNVDIDDSSNIIEVYYFIRVKAKEKKEELQSAKLASVAGTIYVLENGENECYGNLTIKGKLMKQDKVPQAVKNALP